MKTTTYTFENGKMKTTITDRPELTPEQYRDACETIRAAAKAYVNRTGRGLTKVLATIALDQMPMHEFYE